MSRLWRTNGRKVENRAVIWIESETAIPKGAVASACFGLLRLIEKSHNIDKWQITLDRVQLFNLDLSFVWVWNSVFKSAQNHPKLCPLRTISVVVWPPALSSVSIYLYKGLQLYSEWNFICDPCWIRTGEHSATHSLCLCATSFANQVENCQVVK